MDKFKTIGVGGLPHTLNDFRQFLGRLDAPSEGIYQAFNNLLRGFGDDFIVQGCVVSGSTGAFSITEGWILLSGELIKVDAQGPFDEAVDGTFTKVTTFDSRGTKTFLNGSINETYEKNRGVVSGLAGSLDFNGNTFFQLSNQAIFGSGIVTLQKKVVSIGIWNMEADQTLPTPVPHGLSDILKIRTVNVFIRDDNGTGVRPLNAYDNALPGLAGGVISIGTASIAMQRRNGSIFDTTSHNSVAFDRGNVIIEFEA